LKVAISTDGNVVSAHFGRCPSFTIALVEDGKVKEKEVIDNPGHHPGFLPEFLSKKGVEAIIAGGMGQRAATLFAEQGIKTILGASGEVEKVLADFASGCLVSGESSCQPGAGKGYGLDKTECDHEGEKTDEGMCN